MKALVALLLPAANWISMAAVSYALMASDTTFCNPGKVSTVAPPVRAMACCTAARLSAVKPVMPKVSSCACVLAGPPVAPVITACAAVAKSCSFVTVSTLTVVKPSTTSLSRLALGVVRPVTPIVVKGAVPLRRLSLLAVPSAALRIKLYALTMPWTSAVVSARVPMTYVLLSAELMAARLFTPVTPASL